jgi:anaerobic C4-dicarboxylate transporter
LTAVALIVATGFFPELRTLPGQAKPVGMSLVIECVMLAVGAIMLTVTKADVGKIATSPTLKAGVISIASVFGLAWMSDSFIAANRQFFMDYAGTFVQSAPWAFAFVLFIMSGLLNSQGATTRGVMPLGIALGIDPWYLVAMFPAVCGVYLLPTTGPALAAVAFDRSGTTRIGKYVLNHSFQFPGVCMVTISVILGFVAVGFF